MATVGNLEVLVMQCVGLKDVQTFGRQDPFAQLELTGTGQRFQTKTATDQGKHPTWNERFTWLNINPSYSTEMSVKILNKNMMASDELVGTGRIPMNSVYALGTEEKRVQLVTEKGKSAGELQLLFTWKPQGAPLGAAPMMQQPQRMVQAAPAPVVVMAPAPVAAAPPAGYMPAAPQVAVQAPLPMQQMPPPMQQQAYQQAPAQYAQPSMQQQTYQQAPARYTQPPAQSYGQPPAQSYAQAPMQQQYAQPPPMPPAMPPAMPPPMMPAGPPPSAYGAPAGGPISDAQLYGGAAPSYPGVGPAGLAPQWPPQQGGGYPAASI